MAISSKENAKTDKEEGGKKVMKKGMTKSLKELKDLPVETLVKIFNYLPNHDIRCRVSLVCQKFRDICQLVPVKDLSIHGYIYWSDDPTSYGKASFDYDEKVSNPERAFDVNENDDIVENFNGSEIELMFATTYRKQLLPLSNKNLNLPLFRQLTINFSLACFLNATSMLVNKCSVSTTESAIHYAKKSAFT